jgi:hypothetical protein
LEMADLVVIVFMQEGEGAVRVGAEHQLGVGFSAPQQAQILFEPSGRRVGDSDRQGRL